MISLLLLAFAAFGSSMQGALHAAPVVTLDVNWPSFLGRSDPVWSWNSTASMPYEWTKSLFGGNGMLGFMLWAPIDMPLNTMRLDIGRSDLYDDRTPDMPSYLNNFAFDQPRLPIGHFIISWRGTTLGSTGRLSLWDAVSAVSVSTSAGGVALRVWANGAVDAGDVIVLEVNATGGEAVSVVWSPEPALSTWSGDSAAYVPNPPCGNTSTPLSPGRTLNTTSQLHLKGTGHSTAVLAVDADAGASVYYTSVSPVLTNTGASDAYTASAVQAAASVSASALLYAHTAWWHAWWPAGGFITTDYSVLESFWWIQLYKFASASRSGRALHDLQGPWFIDGTNWPDLHWDMNLQQTYYLPLLANRPDISSTLTDFMAGIHASGALAGNVPEAWRVDSSGAPTGASSLSGNMSCYWNYGPNCTTSPPSVTGNLLWACHLLLLAGQYSGNSTVHTQVLWPILGRALQAYQHFQISLDGSVHLPPTFSPEYPGPTGPDANYDLALYRWGLSAAAWLAETYSLTSPDEQAWAATLQALTWYSVDNASDTFSIYAGIPYGTPHRHYSHLFMIWPLRALDFRNASQFRTAKGSIDRWLATPEEDSQFYRPAASAMNVMLGQVEAAFDNITYLLHTRIEANTMYREGSQGACTETPYAAAWAVADWMAQSWNKTMGSDGSPATIFDFYPGIPDVVRLDQGSYAASPSATAVSGFYRLGAEGGYTMTGSRIIVSQNTSHLVTTPLFIALEPGTGTGVPGELHVRTTLVRPMASYPAGLNITDLPDGTTRVSGIPAGTGFVLYSAGSPVPNPPVLTVRPGCPAQFNAWGYHATGGSGEEGVAPTPVVLRNCSYGADGRVQPSQAYEWNAAAGTFALHDGSGRCLSVATCSAANGDAAVLVPCASGGGGAGLGCEAGCEAASQSWKVTGPSDNPPNAIAASSSGRCLEVNGAFYANDIDVWDCGGTPGQYKNEQFAWNASSGGIQSLDTDACCMLMCLTPAD